MIGQFRNLVVQDFWLKLFSLLLATLTWLAVNFILTKKSSPLAPLVPTDVRTFLNLPVVVMSSAEEVRDFKVSPNQASVTVQGEARLMQSLQPKDIRVLVDLSGVRASGQLRRQIEVSTPPGISYVQVVPPQVEVVYPPK
jgi:YbbR domain-containing protein